ncbi:glycosyltransferase [Egicoccus halophilus]|uniref:Glycosyl transferase family 2 n=1 Tax=Egicoccus halophilus TaxID=1670830 RepID=A0A8J3ETZ2_9ACTN|nr:glycosyltransferase [Egicoccus halophilus]GGI06067.1 hypothetical protein GCM10011354_17250 [Egicoccus halophilus]
MPTPALSVIVVTPHDFAQLRRTVAHLRVQDGVEDTELVLVAPDEAAVADAEPAELAAFGQLTVVPVGPIDNVDRAAARGMLAASAPVVATIEDHAYVQAGWIRAVLAAYEQGDWVSVGSVMGNANPDSSFSWANLMLGYGWWIDRDHAGEMDDVPSHNATYRREAVAAFGDELPRHVGRDGDLHERLRQAGGRMYLAPDASITHANPSTLAATADLRFNAGRLYGAERAEDAGWSFARRLFYALASPLIPLVRLKRFFDERLAPGRSHAELFPAVLPGLIAALVLDAAGQAVGYLRGPGAAPDVLATFEMDRLQHLDRRDRRLLSAPPAPPALPASSPPSSPPSGERP